MRTPTDMLLSVQRYTAAILAAPWEVRLMTENVNPVRPFVLISQNGTVSPIGKFGVHSVRMQGVYTIHAYPPQGATRREAELAAQEIEDAFWEGIKLIGTSVAPAPGAGGGVVADTSPKGDKVPLWDFATDPANPSRAYCDFADVTDFQTRPIPDPADPRLQTVVCDLRLAWWRSGSIVPRGTRKLAVPGIRASPGVLGA